MKVRICELCNAEAAVFCPSDAAFLCWTCDAKVHQVNFLVARHFRHPLINDDDSLSSSNSSIPKECPYRRRRNVDSSSSVNRPADYLKTEDIFLNWIGKLGVGGGEMAVRIACSAMRDGWKVLPFRVCLAASMWLGLRMGTEGDKSVILKRMEEISGVPAKVILVAEWKVRRALRVRSGRQQQQQQHRVGVGMEVEEGWAEC